MVVTLRCWNGYTRSAITFCFSLHIGLGKQSQGISTALSVQKTSKRGGKIVNASAERGRNYCIIYTPFVSTYVLNAYSHRTIH